MRALVSSVAAAGLLLAAAPAAGASSWSRPLTIHAGTARFDEPVPRVAIAADGTSVLSYAHGEDLYAVTGDAHGRFGRPQRLGRWASIVTAPAAAPGGAALVAFEAPEGVRVAVRRRAGRPLRVRTIAPAAGLQAINDLAAGADVRGGWFVIESRFSRASRTDAIHSFTLRRDGTLALREQTLGPGQFGAEARPVRALAVDDRGFATATWLGTQGAGVSFAQAVHAGRFGPVRPLGTRLTDPRVTASPAGDGRALITAVESSRCGDAGCSGQPVAARLANGTTPVPYRVPAVRYPNRVFGPSIAPFGPSSAVLVYSEKLAPAAFSREAAVRAVVLHEGGAPGGVQMLTPALATEPVVEALDGDRVLAVWTGRRGWGASTAVDGGHFHPTAVPLAPPPEPYHTNPTNRALSTAGPYAILGWSRGGVVRVSVRRF